MPPLPPAAPVHRLIGFERQVGGPFEVLHAVEHRCLAHDAWLVIYITFFARMARLRLEGDMQPQLQGGGLQLRGRSWLPSGDVHAQRIGQAIDFSNVRRSHEVSLSPSAQFSLGRGLGVDVSHNFQRLQHAGERVFTANLFQTRVIYNFNVRTFVRGIVQYRSVRRNPAKYLSPVGELDEGLFGQFLFSYKLNPQTVAFVGYSENQAGTEGFELTRSDRTFFFKLGYAWRP